jgi:ribosomal protein S12 methylthiotransferase
MAPRDSELILTRLRAEGYGVVSSYAQADLVVVNTCGFIDAAVEESLEAIGEALEENGRVVVTGCLGARAELVRQAHPKVLAVTGPHALGEVMDAVHRHLPPAHTPFERLVPPQGVRLTPRHYAYLKVSEGCNHRCTFCIIPALRGDLASRPAGEVLREAETLVEAGVREILVIAQDTSAYGLDLRYRPDIWRGRAVRAHIQDLAVALGELGVWVRLHYVYPYPHVDALIPLMAEGRLLPYLDVPLQHASPRVLRAMRRPADAEDALARIRRWRSLCPELTLRSTFIVGFPGETEAEFEALLAFLQAADLDRVGCFAYSPVEGAAANALADPVPAEIREERRARLMALQETISARRLAEKVGETLTVLVDEVGEDGAVARGPGDAPEIDGQVLIPEPGDMRVGELYRVRVTGAGAHDLWGERVTGV